MKSYLALFRIRFVTGMQYRASALGGVAAQFTWGIMLILQFSAFYRSDPTAFPMPLSQVASYIWIQQAFIALFASWYVDYDLFATITSGSIAYELARPVSLYNRWFFHSSANRISKAALRCLPILVVAFLLPEPFRMTIPDSFEQFTAFLVSAVLALAVVVAFMMLLYISAFYTLSPLGIRLVAGVGADFLAGAIIPLPFFPENIQRVVEMLPFAAMQNMPLRIYSGNIAGIDILYGLGLQLFWLIILVMLGKLAMKKALRRVVVQGG